MLFPSDKWMQIDESRNAGQNTFKHSCVFCDIWIARICDSISDPDSILWGVARSEGDNPLVSCCRDAGLPHGAARAGAGGRERERERPESILQLTTVTTSPASSAPAATQHPAVKASRNRGSGAFVTIFCEKLRVLGPGDRCVCLYQTDRGCKPVKSWVKSVSIVCECWAKSKMATVETKIWIAINPKNIWMTASGVRPSCFSRHGWWPGW